jgi:hypothetical protein
MRKLLQRLFWRIAGPPEIRFQRIDKGVVVFLDDLEVCTFQDYSAQIGGCLIATPLARSHPPPPPESEE